MNGLDGREETVSFFYIARLRTLRKMGGLELLLQSVNDSTRRQLPFR